MSPTPIFPVYRRSADSRHFYCIEGVDRFVEVQRIGARRVVHHVKATQYPERLRIMEMIDGAEGRWLPVERTEWLDELKAVGCEGGEEGSTGTLFAWCMVFGPIGALFSAGNFSLILTVLTV